MVVKATIDTNVLISALLSPRSPMSPSTVVRRAILGEFEFVISEATISEVLDKTANKPFLARRLSRDDVERFVAALRAAATIVPAPSVPLPAATRDPKDDYLLAPEIVTLVDYIVTGDKDLLEAEGLSERLVLTPAEFLRLLDEQRDTDRQS